MMACPGGVHAERHATVRIPRYSPPVSCLLVCRRTKVSAPGLTAAQIPDPTTQPRIGRHRTSGSKVRQQRRRFAHPATWGGREDEVSSRQRVPAPGKLRRPPLHYTHEETCSVLDLRGVRGVRACRLRRREPRSARTRPTAPGGVVPLGRARFEAAGRARGTARARGAIGRGTRRGVHFPPVSGRTPAWASRLGRATGFEVHGGVDGLDVVQPKPAQ